MWTAGAVRAINPSDMPPEPAPASEISPHRPRLARSSSRWCSSTTICDATQPWRRTDSVCKPCVLSWEVPPPITNNPHTLGAVIRQNALVANIFRHHPCTHGVGRRIDRGRQPNTRRDGRTDHPSVGPGREESELCRAAWSSDVPAFGPTAHATPPSSAAAADA